MKMTGLLRIAALVTLTIAPVAVSRAAEFEVSMLNVGANGAMVFEPDLVQAAPGDTINFVAVDPGHNVETIKGMLPEGVEPFKSKPSKDYSVTLTAEGVYGIRCTPHFGLGMVMLIVVGDPVNLADAEAAKLPPKAKARLSPLFAEIHAN